jgi:predicted acylesterase/phospholipase RssA
MSESEKEPQLLTKENFIETAKNYLNNSINPEATALNTLIKDLVRFDQFAYATELVIKKYNGEIPDSERQHFAKYIYKDHSLPSAIRFSKALKELELLEDNGKVNSCETYGLRGAIYKRSWEFNGQFKNLFIARKHYSKGLTLWKQFIEQPAPHNFKDVNSDSGYTAVNTAFINELLAVELIDEGEEALGIDDAVPYLEEAFAIRTFIVQKIADPHDASELEQKLKKFLKENNEEEGVINSTFVYATLLEAHFGQFDFDKAGKVLHKILSGKGITKWKKRSVAKQLIAISAHQDKLVKLCAQKNGEPPCRGIYKTDVEVIKKRESIIAQLLYNADTAKSEQGKKQSTAAEKNGKYGLGLSGGGHRAALYHVGVLASLAENDLLKNIEVISCVSGGSIAGAFYYLCLKNLLEKKKDAEIDKADYIRIVRFMQKHFKNGIQKNLRSRMFANLWDNLRMMSTNYTRTHKMGELYEKYFYRLAASYNPITGAAGKSTKVNKELTMPKLIIEPADEGKDFDILYDNWKRTNKIPQIVLNATCLNTGHNFQFTAKWMGVPPGNMQPDIDVKPRLRRMYYTEAPGGYKDFRLGYAVAASSCVPAIFRALPMKNLYQDMDVQLIDGGYHENQGVAALLEQECKNLIISDGSGQLSTADKETLSDLSVFYRADVILQERVRELEFMDVKNRHKTSQLESVMIVHLRMDLTKLPKNWIECNDPPRRLIYSSVNNGLDKTDYGIDKKMQQSISEVRTDLDSFNDTEAYMLMYDGYMQMNKEVAGVYKITTGQAMDADDNWAFLAMTETKNMEKAERLMPYSKENAFKVFRYLNGYLRKGYPRLLKYGIPLLLLACIVLACYVYGKPMYEWLSALQPAVLVSGGLVIVAVFFWKKVLHVLLAILKFIIFRFHIHTVDQFFIKAGKIDVSRAEKKHG